MKKDNNWLKIPKLGIEVQKHAQFEKVLLKDIVVPRGLKLIDINIFFHLINNYKNEIPDWKIKIDEAIIHPILKERKKYPFYNLWFGSLGSRSILNGGRYLDCGNLSRWVRFYRKMKNVNKHTKIRC